MFEFQGTPCPPNRKRRQVTGPSLDFIFPDPPQPFSIENLNYTEEQREFCNNVTECMFDLLFTGDTEIAGNTLDVTTEATRQGIELSKKLLLQTCIPYSRLFWRALKLANWSKNVIGEF